MRGVAALAVFVSHSANIGLLPHQLGNGFGQMGVTLFFILSGFLMAHLYAGQSLTGSLAASFARNRAGRVLPLYYGLLALSLVLPLYPVKSYLEHALLLRGDSVLWTIPVEIHFYITFVGLWWLIDRGWLGVRGLAIGVGIAYVTAWLAGKVVNGNDYLIFWLHPFLFGVLVARLKSAPSVPAWLALAILVIALPGLRLDMGLPVLRPYKDPLSLLAPALIFLSALSGHMRVLEAPVARFMGRISYCLYLVHLPVLAAVANLPIPLWSKPLIALALAVLASWLSLLFFETPLRRWITGRTNS